MQWLQRNLRLLSIVIAFGTVLTVVSTVMAQEGEGPKVEEVEVSYFGQFFASDSAVGTAVIWMLIVNSTVLMSIIIQAAIANRKSEFMPPALVDQFAGMVEQKQYRDAMTLVSNSRSVCGQVLNHAMQQAKRGFDAMEQAAFEMAEQIGNDKVRKLVWMEVAGAAGPMMGLFGTVYGMIVAFTQLVALGGNPKPAELAGGIATALVCTFWGLVVGIPGVISAAVFRVKIEGLTASTIFTVQELIAPFRGGVSLPAAPAPAKAGEQSAAADRPAGKALVTA